MDDQDSETMTSEKFSVLIIKSTTQSLKNEEAYLKNRNWEIGQAVTMKEALTYILQKRPQYVLIDIDHPNKKMKILPNVLIQAFPIKVIVFAKFESPSALTSLREVKQAYPLFPPISGPAIERLVLKVRKEQAGVEDLTLRFKGAPIDRSVLAELARLQEPGDTQEVPKIVQEGPGHGKKFSLKQEGPGHGKKFSLKQEEAGGDSLAKESGQGLKSPVLLNTKMFINDDKKKDSPIHESIVAQGAVEALKSNVSLPMESPKSEEETIDRVTNVACIVVESPRFSGYLVTAMGRNRKIDKVFIETLKKRLFLFLQANGETPTEEDTLEIKIKEIEFEDWALEQAAFLRKSLCKGYEIAMAFFPFHGARTQFENSHDKEMIKLSLEEFKEDVIVEFDLFIHMPINDKYLLYTPRGSTLKKAQKGRLAEKGITHIHLKRESLSEVKKYRAQNYLNERIEHFQSELYPRRASS